MDQVDMILLQLAKRSAHLGSSSFVQWKAPSDASAVDSELESAAQEAALALAKYESRVAEAAVRSIEMPVRYPLLSLARYSSILSPHSAEPCLFPHQGH